MTSRAACVRCRHPNPIIAGSEVAINADHQAVRTAVALCKRCRYKANIDNKAAERRTTRVGSLAAVLLLQELWHLPTAPEPHYLCRTCGRSDNTPAHYYGCEKKRWP